MRERKCNSRGCEDGVLDPSDNGLPSWLCPKHYGQLMETFAQCRPGAHQSMFEEILERLGKVEVEAKTAGKDALAALAGHRWIVLEKRLDFVEKDLAAEKRLNTALDREDYAKLQEQEERLGKVEDRLDNAIHTSKTEHVPRLEALEHESQFITWGNWDVQVLPGKYMALVERVARLERIKAEQQTVIQQLEERVAYCEEAFPELINELKERVARLEKTVDAHWAAILVSPTSDYCDQHFEDFEGRLTNLEDGLKTHGHNIPGRGLVTKAAHSSISTIPPDSAWWMEGYDGPEPNIEQLAEYARDEYHAALGLAQGDWPPWDEHPGRFRSAWCTTVRAILDEVSRG